MADKVRLKRLDEKYCDKSLVRDQFYRNYKREILR